MLALNPTDGKLLVHFSDKLQDIEIEYLCLNSSIHMTRLLDQVDKMVLASGTLEPAGELESLCDEPWKFHCGHIIPKE